VHLLSLKLPNKIINLFTLKHISFMQTFQLQQVNRLQPNPLLFAPVNYQEIEEVKSTPVVSLMPVQQVKKPFIEANTKEVSLTHLKQDCIVPVFSKDNEITISHNRFIETVWDSVNNLFRNETIYEPEIRVSHVVKGRTPDAIHKLVKDLTDEDKTIYYERMMFCIEIPSITETICGNRLNLTIGGVRSYNLENLYSKKSVEKFKVFIGFKNMVCCNMCVSTDGLKDEIKVTNTSDLMAKVIELIVAYNAKSHLDLMKSLHNYSLTESQFAQFLGKSRLYQCLPNEQKRFLPKFLMTDTQTNLIARGYYQDEDFRVDKAGQELSMWNVYNLLTTANKSSYIDNFSERALNATHVSDGITRALNGENRYRWFIE